MLGSTAVTDAFSLLPRSRDGKGDEPDTIAAQPGQVLVVESCELHAIEADGARGRVIQAGEDVHKGRLA